MFDPGLLSDMAAAEEHFRAATEEAPDYAMAHTMLGWAIRWSERADGPLQLGLIAAHPRRDEYMRSFEKAFQWSERAHRIDGLYAQASYFEHSGEEDNAIARYETLLRIEPGHRRGGLRRIYEKQERFQALHDVAIRGAELRPNHLQAQGAAATKLLSIWELDRAKQYMTRYRMLGELMGSTHVHSTNWILFPAYEHWYKGEIDKAIEVVDTYAETFEGLLNAETEAVPRDFSSALRNAGSLYLAFGKLEKARAVFEQIPARDLNRHQLLGWLAEAVDDEQALRAHLLALGAPDLAIGGPGFWLEAAPRRARAGLLPLPGQERDLDGPVAVSSSPSPRGHSVLAWGEWALGQDDLDGAITRLARGMELTREESHFNFYRGAESLADAYQRLGKDEEALGVLEDAAEVKARYYV